MKGKLYYIKITSPFNGKVYYKIGITNKDSVEERFKHNEGMFIVLCEWDYTEGITALFRETMILRKYRRFITQDNLDFWKGGGVSEIFDRDVLKYDTVS